MLSMGLERNRVRGIALIIVLVITVVHAFTTLQPASSNMTKQTSSSSLSLSSPPSPPLDKNSSSRFRLGYVTDVEGNLVSLFLDIQSSLFGSKDPTRRHRCLIFFLRVAILPFYIFFSLLELF